VSAKWRASSLRRCRVKVGVRAPTKAGEIPDRLYYRQPEFAAGAVSTDPETGMPADEDGRSRGRRCRQITERPVICRNLVATERSLRRAGGDNRRKRLVVGWFSFTCCKDSTILLTELLNDRLDDWKKVIEFRHMKALKDLARCLSFQPRPRASDAPATTSKVI
jgi:hypothetical protein